MEDQLIELLSTFEYPVFRQGSLTKDEPYPSSFFTFWNSDSPDHAHYDNKLYGTAWEYEVNFYSTNPQLTYDVLILARNLLRKSGWITTSKGYDVLSDEATHTGRGMQVYYLDAAIEEDPED